MYPMKETERILENHIHHTNLLRKMSVRPYNIPRFHRRLTYAGLYGYHNDRLLDYFNAEYPYERYMVQSRLTTPQSEADYEQLIFPMILSDLDTLTPQDYSRLRPKILRYTTSDTLGSERDYRRLGKMYTEYSNAESTGRLKSKGITYMLGDKQFPLTWGEHLLSDVEGIIHTFSVPHANGLEVRVTIGRISVTSYTTVKGKPQVRQKQFKRSSPDDTLLRHLPSVENYLREVNYHGNIPVKDLITELKNGMKLR